MDETSFNALKNVIGSVIKRLMQQGATPEEAATLAQSMFERDYPVAIAAMSFYLEQQIQVCSHHAFDEVEAE